MKLANLFVCAVISGMLVSSVYDTAAAAAAGKGNGNQRGGKAAEHMSSKGAANTNAQWSADPEKGWIRAGERQELKEKNGSPTKVNANNGRQKGKEKGNKS